MILHNNLNFFDESISSGYFKEFIFKQIEINKKYSFDEYYDVLKIYDPYNKLSTGESYFFKKKKSNFLYSWSYYTPLFRKTLNLWEYPYKFTKSHYSVCSFSNYDLGNECFYYKFLEKNIEGENFIFNFPFLNNDKTYFQDKLNSFKKLDKKTVIYEMEDLNFIEKKFDIIYVRYEIEKTISIPGYVSYMGSDILSLIMLLYSLHYLEKGGMLIYNIGSIVTPLKVETLGFLEKYFKVEIVKPKSEIYEKNGGFILYCHNFKPHRDIQKLYQELIKIYPKYGTEWKWTKKYKNVFPEGNGFSNYQNELFNKNFKYPSIGKYEKVREKVLKLNEEYFSNALFDITRISELLERQIPHEEKKKYLEKQKFACLDWAEEFNWRLKPNLDFEPFIDQEGIKIIENIFGYQYLKPLELTFKNSSTKSPKTLEKLLHLKNRLHLAEVVIDTRDIDAYEKIKKETDIYRKNLHPIITQKYNAQAVTQAWQKMYEICSVLPLIEGDKMKTFHACEAPGAFIIAFNHYLKTKTNVDWDWEAQSLHQSASQKAFGDQFGLIGNYPEKWDFGNGSGNITRKNNIEHYIEKCKDVDLITLDCAAPLDERDEKMEFLNFSFFYFVLKGTKIGGKALFKMFLNVDKMEIYMLYLLARSFEKLYFYKPLQNPRSKEIYVLCYQKKEEIKDEKIENIFKTKKINIDYSLPKTFLDKLYEIFNFYTEQFEKSMQDKIYYLDNLELMDEFDKDLIESSIRATNLLWLKRFPLIKIKNSDKLNLKT